jgi:hypothetical protein
MSFDPGSCTRPHQPKQLVEFALTEVVPGSASASELALGPRPRASRAGDAAAPISKKKAAGLATPRALEREVATPPAADANKIESTDEGHAPVGREHHHVDEVRRRERGTEGDPSIGGPDLADDGGDLKRHLARRDAG